VHSKQQIFRTLWGALALATAITLVVGMFVIPAFAQNPVPPTARQAATMPEFASRLAHPVAPEAAGKPRGVAPTRNHAPSPQDQVLYENGPANGTTDAWTINFGYVVSDSFTAPANSTVTGFDIWAWEFPGDVMTAVDWSVTSAPNGGTVYGSGTANVTDRFISTNQYGYNIDKISVSGLNAGTGSGTFFLNLQNAIVPDGDPIYWDENSGVGCHSAGCPSQAVENEFGTIPSEAFDVVGTSNGYPCGSGLSEPAGPNKAQAGQAQSFQVIYNFTGGVDGASPNGLARDQAGNFYGTASAGGYTGGHCGQGGCGTVFELAHQGSGWVLKPLYNFAGQDNSDGASPGSKPLLGPDGTVYGATNGGGHGYGTVYNLKPAPTACRAASCSWMETVLYRFPGTQEDDSDNGSGGACSSQLNLPALKLPLDGTDGAFPWGNLASDQAGNIYGVANAGPRDSGCSCRPCGLIYEVSPSVDGWVESIVHRFDMYSGGLTSGLSSDSTIGITTFIKWSMGGDDWDFGGYAGGFKLPRDGSMGAWPLSIIFDPSNVFFTTLYNGADCPGGLFTNYERRLYTGGTGDLKVEDSAGNLYGINGNTIFRMSPSGGWTPTVVYNFSGGADGGNPDDLIFDANGNLWGTTASGGANGKGVIFEITP